MNKKIIKIITFALVVIASSPALSDDIAKSILKKQVEDSLKKNGDELCKKYEPLSLEDCKAIITSVAVSAVDGKLDIDDLKDKLKKGLNKPEFYNTILGKVLGEDPPIDLALEALDAEDGDSVLGLTYAIDYNFVNEGMSSDGNWNRSYAVAFNASGTVTNESDENPRNFLDTKFTLSTDFITKIPVQTEEFGINLTNYQSDAGLKCQTPPPTEECKAAKAKFIGLLDSTSKFLQAFQRYELGLDFGYESNQSFSVTQRKISAFAFAQYESWGNNKLFGTLTLSPAIRLGVDTINPSKDTPRALAGDDSRYERFSGEMSFWIPVQDFTGIPAVLTYSYRHYGEISPSSIVKSARLDSYNLRTLSITTTNGLFASYSSGRLPLSFQNDDVIELGWKLYWGGAKN